MWIGCSPNQTCVRFGEPQRRLASRGPIKPIQMRGVVDREQVTVEEEMLKLHSENLHEKHKYTPLRGAARRRAWALREEERLQEERRAHWRAHIQGRGVMRGEFVYAV